MSNTEVNSADLVRMLYAEDKAVRNEAAKELGSRGAEGFAAAVPLITDASWVVRYRACEIIGMTRQPDAFPVLLRLLSDSCDHVRYMAVQGLGILGDTRALPDVVRMREDKNPFVRRIAGKVAAALSYSGG